MCAYAEVRGPCPYCSKRCSARTSKVLVRASMQTVEEVERTIGFPCGRGEAKRNRGRQDRRFRAIDSTWKMEDYSCRKRSLLTASDLNAAWKKEMVCNHCNQGLTFDRLIKRPVNNRLNNMTIVPIRLATLVFAHAIEMSKMTLAVVRLNSTSVRITFQKAATVGTQSQRGRTQYLRRATGEQRVAEGCQIESSDAPSM